MGENFQMQSQLIENRDNENAYVQVGNIYIRNQKYVN